MSKKIKNNPCNGFLIKVFLQLLSLEQKYGIFHFSFRIKPSGENDTRGGIKQYPHFLTKNIVKI